MKAEQLNCEYQTGLEKFSQLIRNANANLAKQKLNDYGLVDKDLGMSDENSPSPLKTLNVFPVKKEVYRKTSDGDKRLPSQINPFKLKLKVQLGL